MMKIGKCDKKISFTKPKSGYTPTEFDECLVENVDSKYRRFVFKQVLKMKLNPKIIFVWC